MPCEAGQAARLSGGDAPYAGRVVVCDVFESLRNASASLLFGKHIVYGTLPDTEPIAVSISVGMTPGCARSQARTLARLMEVNATPLHGEGGWGKSPP